MKDNSKGEAVTDNLILKEQKNNRKRNQTQTKETFLEITNLRSSDHTQKKGQNIERGRETWKHETPQ